MKRWIPLLAILLLIVLFWEGLYLKGDAEPIDADRPIMAFRLPTLNQPDREATEAVFQGEVQLVHFWATWCPTCRKEHPLIKQMSAELGIPIISVSYFDKPVDVHSFLERHDNPYKLNIMDESRLLGFQWGVSGVPETFLIDKKGKIRYRFKGQLTKKTIENNLKPAILELQKDA